MPLNARRWVLGLALLLVACNGEEVAAPQVDVVGAKIGVIVTPQIGEERSAAAGSRPGPTLGLYTATYLAQGSPSGLLGAVKGLRTQLQLQDGPQGGELELQYQILQQLGDLLQVNVPDLMNRSSDRAKALDEYLATLVGAAQRSQDMLLSLEEELDQVGEDRRDKRDALNDIQSRINSALREEDYATAGANQEALALAREESSQLENQERQIRNTIDLYEELLEVAEERVLAIQQNREVLIAGLKVVEVPGIEPLGILEEQRRRGGSRDNPFDLEDL